MATSAVFSETVDLEAVPAHGSAIKRFHSILLRADQSRELVRVCSKDEIRSENLRPSPPYIVNLRTMNLQQPGILVADLIGSLLAM